MWWCYRCNEEVSGHDVTFEEQHDRRNGGCGCEVTWIETEEDLINGAIQLLIEKGVTPEQYEKSYKK